MGAEEEGTPAPVEGEPSGLIRWLFATFGFDSRHDRQTTAPPTEPHLPSEALPRAFGDRYEVCGLLGRGGMGVVYRVRDNLLHREVALKSLIRPGVGIERFLREARAIAGLACDGIVRLHEIDQWEGIPYFTMEFHPGGSLEGLLEREGPMLPPRRAAEIARSVARALQFAHDKKLVHRDVKPANILFDAAGRPVLSDFGLVRDATRDEGRTDPGTFLGTAAYASPEHAGAGGEGVGSAADQYSLGIVLYRMATGRLPFSGKSQVEQIAANAHSDPILPSRFARIGRDLETVILKTLEKAPRCRYPSCGALADDLGRFLEGEPISARPPGLARTLARIWRKRGVRSAVLALSSVVLAAVSAVALAPAWISVESDPPGATVRILGREEWSGTTPFEQRIWPARDLRVEIRRPGFRTIAEQVDLSSWSRVKRSWSLERLQGRLTLTGRSGPFVASISGIDWPADRYEWRGPFEERTVPAGRYRLRVEDEDVFPFEAEFEIAPDKTTCLELDLMPIEISRALVRDGLPGPLRLADIDRDGLLDVVGVLASAIPGRITIASVSGRGGFDLWRTEIDEDSIVDLRLADLDRDGVPDAIVVGSHLCLAISGRSGATLWSFAPGDVPRDRTSWRPGLASVVRIDDDASPDVAFGLTGGADGRLLALSGADGRLLWSVELHGVLEETPDSWRADAPALPANDRLVFPVRGRGLVCVARGNGAVLWERLERGLVGELVSTGERIAFATRDGRLGRIDLADGTRVEYSERFLDLIEDFRAAGADRTALATGRRSDETRVLVVLPSCRLEAATTIPLAASDVLPAIRDGNRVILPRGSGVVASVPLEGRALGWAARPGGRLTAIEVGDFDADGEAEILAATEEGELVWYARRPRSGTSTFDPGRALSAPPVLGNLGPDGLPHLLLVGPDGSAQFVEGRTGRPVDSAPKVSGRVIAAGSADLDADGRIEWILVEASLEASAWSGGQLLWRRSLSSVAPAFGAVSIEASGDLALFALEGRDLVAVDGRTGEVRWRHRATEPIAWGPALVEREGERPLVAVGTATHTILALDGATGAPLWESPSNGAKGDAGSASVDGDGTADLVMPLAAGGLVALSGRDGTMLWRAQGRFERVAATTDASGRGWIAAVTSSGTVAFFDQDGHRRWLERAQAVGRAVHVGWFRAGASVRAIAFDGEGHAAQIDAERGRVGRLYPVRGFLRTPPVLRVTERAVVAAGVLDSGAVVVLEFPLDTDLEEEPSPGRLWPLVRNARWPALLAQLERIPAGDRTFEGPFEALEGLARGHLDDPARGRDLLLRAFEAGWRIPEAMAVQFSVDPDRVAREYCSHFPIEAIAYLSPEQIASPAIRLAAGATLAGLGPGGSGPDPRRSMLLGLAGRPEEAIFELDLLASPLPRDATLVRALVNLLAGDSYHAGRAWRDYRHDQPEDRVLELLSPRFIRGPEAGEAIDRSTRQLLGRAQELARADRLDDALESILKYERRVPEDARGPVEEARIRLCRGEREEAVEALERARDAGFEDMKRIFLDPTFRTLRSDPKWIEKLQAR